MEKVSISRFTEKVIEQHGGDKAETVLIIVADGPNVTTSCIGPDPLFINDKAVTLAGAMRTILDEKFKLANSMYEHLKQNGRIRSELHERVVDAPEAAFTEDKPKEQPKPEAKAAPSPEEEFFHGLFELLERTFGGVADANDD